MDYRRASCIEDFKQIVALQNKNIKSKLSESEQENGFLSAEFSVEQFQEMNDDLCIMLCLDNNYVCGYLVASSIQLNKKFPIVNAMIDCFPNITYKNRPLIYYKTFISGPVCIDKNYRGKNIFVNLVQETIDFLLKQDDAPNLLTTFISNNNPRSINAHKKMEMDIISQFKFNEQLFSILIKPV